MIKVLFLFLLTYFLMFTEAQSAVLVKVSQHHCLNSSSKVSSASTTIYTYSKIHQLKSQPSQNDNNDFISLENDDDDINCSRKYVLMGIGFVPSNVISVLKTFHSNIDNNLPLGKNSPFIASFKYIFLRVLKI